ncbi:MAG: hypothetical protein K1Y36_07910 [Blastocatellia bacterium]|nr:hypothetical protein [Blastocatellia bacterium]
MTNEQDYPTELEREISEEELASRQKALAQLDLLRRVQRARTGTAEERKDLAFDTTQEVLNALLDNEETGEEELKIIANRKDAPPEVLRRLAGDKRTSGSHVLRRILTLNPKLPGSAGLRLVGQLYLFDLVFVLITPAVPMEVKTAAENLILQQYSGIALGQKITMARRVNGIRLIPAMLNDPSPDVVRAVLDNPYLNENIISTAVRKAGFSHVVTLIADSAKWAMRKNVKISLLHSRFLSAGRATTLIQTLSPSEMKELRSDPTVPQPIRAQITQFISRPQPKKF